MTPVVNCHDPLVKFHEVGRECHDLGDGVADEILQDLFRRYVNTVAGTNPFTQWGLWPNKQWRIGGCRQYQSGSAKIWPLRGHEKAPFLSEMSFLGPIKRGGFL